MNLDRIYRKMNLLKTMAEGNYGNETRNAINIIEKLKKEYNKLKVEISYQQELNAIQSRLMTPAASSPSGFFP